MPEEMTHFGAGPKLTAAVAVLCVPAFVAKWLYPEFFAIGLVPYWALAAAGGVLVALSIAMHEWAVGPMKRAFGDGEGGDRLLTTGAFGVCRHPIYAGMVVFGVPGMMLLINSWIGLAAVPLMWAALRIMVRSEERWLEAKFGDEYREYRRRVPAVLPAGWVWSRIVGPRGE